MLCADTEDFRLDMKREGPFDNKSRTKNFRPKAISSSIFAQSTVFTVHKLIDDNFIPLEKNKRYKKKLVKLTLPPSAFSGIRQELNMHSANAALLFPDLDGLCAYLSWRYTKLNDET